MLLNHTVSLHILLRPNPPPTFPCLRLPWSNLQLDNFYMQGPAAGAPTLLRLTVGPPTSSATSAGGGPPSPTGARDVLTASHSSIGTTLSSIVPRAGQDTRGAATRGGLRGSMAGGAGAGDGERPSWHVEWVGVHQLAADGSCTWSRYFWIDR